MDLLISESQGNGGDLFKRGRDLAVIKSFENMVYLAMFGGNPDYPTPPSLNGNEQNRDFWGNQLFLSNDPGTQFNSLTEARLNRVELTSSGRVEIEEAVKRDLEFMREFAEVKVTVSIISDDKIRLDIGIKRPENLKEKHFIYIWDAFQQELELGYISSGEGLEEVLQHNL